MLTELVGHTVVIDLHSPYVCLGTLTGFDDHFIELRNADLHDLRDSNTGRENYIASCRQSGVKRNRKRVMLARSEVVAISLLGDFADE